MSYLLQNLQLPPVVTDTEAATFEFPSGIFPEGEIPNRWIAVCELYSIKLGSPGAGAYRLMTLRREADGSVSLATSSMMSEEDDAVLDHGAASSGIDSITFNFDVSDSSDVVAFLTIRSLSAID